MPLVQPDNLREKLLVIGSGGAGKTTLWLTIAFWAFLSKDDRTFFVLDTDDQAVLHVMNEAKYEGMLRSFNGEVVNPGGNIVLLSAFNWDEYQRFSDYGNYQYSVIAQAKPGDWIVIDFISHAWNAVQEGFLHDAAQKTRGQVLYEAGKEGLTGWDMFKTDFNWNAINGAYSDWIKPILIMSRAHVFMAAEEEQLNEQSRNLPPDQREHIAQFGAWKAVGQKKLPYQCRSFLRVQRLARGRVLHTLKDRARKTLSGDSCDDFMKDYLCSTAGWGISDP